MKDRKNMVAVFRHQDNRIILYFLCIHEWRRIKLFGSLDNDDLCAVSIAY